jgi:hypothetical protein
VTDDPMFCPAHGTPMQDIGPYLDSRKLVCIKCLDDRVAALEAAIREHRGQKADDRCVEDDDRLYVALGDGIRCDRRVGDRAAMLRNCERFIANRCEGGHWPTYAQLEDALTRIAALTGGAEDMAAVHGWTGIAGRRLLDIRTTATRALGRAPCPSPETASPAPS